MPSNFHTYQDAGECLNLTRGEVGEVQVGSSDSCQERLRNRGGVGTEGTEQR